MGLFGSNNDPLLRSALEDLSDDEETVGQQLTQFSNDSVQSNLDSDDKEIPSSEITVHVDLPWAVSRHIEKLAKEYVEHCEKTTEVIIAKKYGFWPILFPNDICEKNLSKARKRKLAESLRIPHVTRTLAWVAIERDKVASRHNTLTAEQEEYKINLDFQDEIEEIKRNNSYISEELSEQILKKEIAFMEWRSRVTEPDMTAIRAYTASLETIIAPQAKLLKMLTNFHAKRLVTSREGAISFVLENVDEQHQQFFTDHRYTIEKYITETYYPDVENDAATE